eukprot:GILJ01006689.1.p1 GENE.GILJ01006689.1~~GILJ01006689.1.p1  ORF type:complete len:340 (-),score=37.75 GILJ01006689.1:132-1076(-)
MLRDTWQRRQQHSNCVLNFDSNLSGKVCVVTGGNQGIGKEVAILLARQNARVFIVCRNGAAAEAAVAEIRSVTANQLVEYMLCDLSSWASVEAFVSAFLALRLPIHILIHNAGVFMSSSPTSSDQIDLRMQVNWLAPVALSLLLLGPLEQGQGRVVNVSSIAHRSAPALPADLNDESDLCSSLTQAMAYARSKACIIMLTHALQRKLRQTRKVTFVSLEPGIVRTALYRTLPFPVNLIYPLTAPLLLKTPRQAADIVCFAALQDDLTENDHVYISESGLSQSSPETYNLSLQDKLLSWTLHHLRSQGLHIPPFE